VRPFEVVMLAVMAVGGLALSAALLIGTVKGARGWFRGASQLERDTAVRVFWLEAVCVAVLIAAYLLIRS
jgi:hypothetical protein